MTKPPLRRARAFVLAMLFAALAGCGGLIKVEGKVTYKGEPAKGAIVILHPEGADNDPNAQRASGVARDDGVFVLATQSQEGVKAGKYRVSVSWPDESKAKKTMKGTEVDIEVPDRLEGRYADPAKSNLHVEVRRGEKMLPPINLE